MSEAFEAIVVVDPGHEASIRADSLPGFRSALLLPNVLGVLRSADRSMVIDLQLVKDHALTLAEGSLVSVALVYDNRVGLEDAHVFQNGGRCSVFGEQDEIWVPLDDLGEPLIDSQGVTAGDLDPSREYDVLHSAIDLGLRFAGAPETVTCAELKQQFCYSELFNG